MSARVLVISAHPDDETLGCGGTLLRHGEAGDDLHWLVLTAPWEPMFEPEWISRRKREVGQVSEAYGMASVRELGLPTARLDTLPSAELIDPIRELATLLQPDIVYVVHGGDVHSDHRAAFSATVSALKPFRSSRTASIYSYECTSSTNMSAPSIQNAFVPQMYVDISGQMERKLGILELYETEIFDPPHPRSLAAVDALARYRGATVSVQHAEAFAVIRHIW